MGFFSRRKRAKAVHPDDANDMRVTPVNNPLDYREDGSIREGDPAWNMMMEAMTSGRAVISNQRPDGTWETETLGDKN